MTDPLAPDACEAAAEARLCAELLALGRGFAHWSFALAVLACAALVWRDHGSVGMAAVLASLACGAIAAYHALRVRLDAALFDDWARRWLQADARPADDLAAFDQALAKLGTEPGHRPARALAARCAGARAMLVRQGLFTVIQTLLLLTAALASG